MAAGVSAGTTTIDESAAGEVSVVAIAATACPSGGFWRKKYGAIWLDCTNSVGGTARIKVDLGAAGATQRTISQYDYVFSAGECFNLISTGPIEADTDIEVFIVRPGTGAAGTDIYYRVEYDTAIDKVQSVFNSNGAADDVDLDMRHLHVNNDAGTAVIFETTNGYSFSCSGPLGTIFAGTGGHGVTITSAGATSDGINIVAARHAIYLGSGGAGHCLSLVAGATGRGIDIVTTAANGIMVDANGAGSVALSLDGVTSGAYFTGVTQAINIASGGKGINMVTTGKGVSITASNYGLEIIGAGKGLHLEGTGVNAYGADILGKGANDGVSITTTGTGRGVNISGTIGLLINGTAGHGISIVAAGALMDGVNIVSAARHGVYTAGGGTGHGFTMVAGGGTGSKDIDADEIDDLVAWLGTTYPAELNRAFQRLGQQIQTAGGTYTYFDI